MSERKFGGTLQSRKRDGSSRTMQYKDTYTEGAYKELGNLSRPITEEIHKTVISLPISPVMTDEEVKKVVEVRNEY